jgi:hypothetical protein
MQRTAVHHIESNEFLGWLTKDNTSWVAQTIFGYTIARTESESEAEAVLQDRGLKYLQGVWQYYDKQDNTWHSCIIKSATEQKVIVTRTDDLGMEDPELYKMVTINSPTENELVKAS